jgi:4a-hydroxytetrahydrobiopterin dehydratase
MNRWSTLQCRPLGPDSALTDDDVDRHLGDLAGWSRRDGALEKTFAFADFHETMAFVNAVAWIAHRQDHHPEVHLGDARCVLRWSTHSARGITANDFICAARVDALLA